MGGETQRSRRETPCAVTWEMKGVLWCREERRKKERGVKRKGGGRIEKG